MNMNKKLLLLCAIVICLGLICIIPQPSPSKADNYHQSKQFYTLTINNNQLDLSNKNLTAFDLEKIITDTSIVNFSTNTLWPTKMPIGFDPKALLSSGMNPGLNIRNLHDLGIKGGGVGIGIIDQALLLTHNEFSDQIKYYETTNSWYSDSEADYHGTVVASIAVGNNVGVAPEANLYYINDALFNHGYTYDEIACSLSNDISKLIEINKDLSDSEKIRVISISLSLRTVKENCLDKQNRELLAAAITKAEAADIVVLTTDIFDEYGDFGTPIKKLPYTDADDYQNYFPSRTFYNRSIVEKISVPIEGKTVAYYQGDNEYQYVNYGGLSWAVPYIAGLYVLCCEVDPFMNYEKFIYVIEMTSLSLSSSYDNQLFRLDKIIQPEQVILYLLSH